MLSVGNWNYMFRSLLITYIMREITCLLFLPDIIARASSCKEHFSYEDRFNVEHRCIYFIPHHNFDLFNTIQRVGFATGTEPNPLKSTRPMEAPPTAASSQAFPGNVQSTAGTDEVIPKIMNKKSDKFKEQFILHNAIFVLFLFTCLIGYSVCHCTGCPFSHGKEDDDGAIKIELGKPKTLQIQNTLLKIALVVS